MMTRNIHLSPDREMTHNIEAFITDTLIPAAFKELNAHYVTYLDGGDIGLEYKKDTTPASEADKQTEKVLRELISSNYPEHGILGEEFPPFNTDRDCVWVLDPLDGTREFLAKMPDHFGTLIAFVQDRKPLYGCIGDPISQRVWTGSEANISLGKPAAGINQSVFACTNMGMFTDTKYQIGMERVKTQAKCYISKKNCLGFAGVIDGHIDLSIEYDLAIHDVVALLPPLLKSGCTALDFEGNDYSDKNFDLPDAAQEKFGIIAARTRKLAEQALGIIHQ